MPPVAILAAATIGAGAIGAGANMAAAGSNASAARSVAASNAGAINANQANNTGLIADVERGNAQAFDSARANAEGFVQAGTQQAADAWRNASNANQGALYDANGRSLADAATLQQQGEGLYGQTAARGQDAGAAINKLLGIGGDASAQADAFNRWLGSTGYQFALKTGADAVSSNAATRGLLTSGGTAKALNTFGQQTGQTYFGNYLAGLQNQQATGLSAANALSGVYGNVAGLKTNANNTLASGLSTNNTNQANALSSLYTGQANSLAGIEQNTASNLRSLQTNATSNLVAANSASTNALVGNANNALGQVVSSNNNSANAISGLAGNIGGAVALGQGLGSYNAPNALASSYQPLAATTSGGVPLLNASSYRVSSGI